MFRQEINLYHYFETPRTSGNLLTWKRYWLLNMAVFVLLTIIYLASMIENTYLANKAKELHLQSASYQTEFQKLKSSLPQLFFNKNTEEAVKSMRSELAAQKEILAILSRHEPFSEVLASFSRSIVPNLWLTNISIQKNGDEITVKGNSVGNNVDEFIAKIDQDKLLKNFNVKLNNVKNNDVTDANTKLTFEITMTRHKYE